MKFITEPSNIILIVVAVVSGAALLIPALQRRGAKVSLLQATQLINQPKSIIIDVRDIAEFETGHIKGAKNIPLTELNNRLSEIEKSKAHPAIIVCATGKRSATAVALLLKAGFTQAVSLEGGLTAWREQGLPTFK